MPHPMDWTMQMALDDARNEVEGDNPPDAMLIVLLRDPAGTYETTILDCGLATKGEVATLLRRAANRTLTDYREEGDET